MLSLCIERKKLIICFCCALYYNIAKAQENLPKIIPPSPTPKYLCGMVKSLLIIAHSETDEVLQNH
jgi:hypothetical protein